MPFDYDPLALDFPALTLQCLQPPPTLYSSTQHPTSTSWSIAPPGPKQYDALRAHFQDAFRRYKIACAAATTAVNEDLTYPPPVDYYQTDTKEAVRRAEQRAEKLEKEVYEHIQSTYAVWDALPQAQQERLWTLELARSVGRKQKELENLKGDQELLRQENASLKAQVDRLNRLQQPREFKIAQPPLIPIGHKLLEHMMEQGLVNHKRIVGFELNGRHLDLATTVTNAIDRWKHVIVSTRTSTTGLQSQKPLDSTERRDSILRAPASSQQEASHGQSSTLQTPTQTRPSSRQNPPQSHASAPAHASVPSPNAAPPTNVSTATPVTATQQADSQKQSAANSPSASDDDDEDEDEDMDDQDAKSDADGEVDDEDADGEIDEMDEDNEPQQLQQYQQPLAALPQQDAQLDVARTRTANQFGVGANRSVSIDAGNNGGFRSNPNLNMNRSATATFPTTQSMGSGNSRHGIISDHAHDRIVQARMNDMSMMQAGGEPMYMD